MFANVNDSIIGVLTPHEEVPFEIAKSRVMKRTFSRGRLVHFLSVKTVEGCNNYPCNTESGPRAGEACSFPYVYPDCKLMKKPNRCVSDPGSVPVEYAGCSREYTESPWCYTRTFHNRSHITGEWGYCSHHCSVQVVRSVSSKLLTRSDLIDPNKIKGFH